MDRGDWWVYSPWDHKESDTAEQLTLSLSFQLFSFQLQQDPSLGLTPLGPWLGYLLVYLTPPPFSKVICINPL